MGEHGNLNTLWVQFVRYKIHWQCSLNRPTGPIQSLSCEGCLFVCNLIFIPLKSRNNLTPKKIFQKTLSAEKRWSILLLFFDHVTSLKKVVAKNWCWCINRKRRKMAKKKTFITYTYFINNTIRIGREIQCFVYAEYVIQHYYLALLQESPVKLFNSTTDPTKNLLLEYISSWWLYKRVPLGFPLYPPQNNCGSLQDFLTDSFLLPSPQRAPGTMIRIKILGKSNHHKIKHSNYVLQTFFPQLGP